MPNYSAHIGLAREVATRMKHPLLEAHMGTVLLGSTAPDIRIITRGTRDEYHFMDLESGTLDEGVQGLFQAYPELTNASRQAKRTRSFIAGYICHLVMDQSWIINLYRPYFSNPEVFEDIATGKVMDRVLQLDLDRASLDGVNPQEEVMPLLAGSEQGVEVDFIPPETLVQWREWVESAVRRGFTWERLRFLSQRRQDPENLDYAQDRAERFLESVSEGLEGVYEKVPYERVQAFKEQAILESIRIIGGYLQ